MTRLTQRLQVYRCEICGHVIEVLTVGRGTLVCCGVPMKPQMERGDGQGADRHLPVIERTEEGVKVVIGQIAHPMEERHFIHWIEVRQGDTLVRRTFRPGGRPEAEFQGMGEDAKVRVYCTLHGLWTNRREEILPVTESS
ncbi:MAG: desulfoferrodoxin [Methanomicrobiales archaeon]|nr:desulfoferrodoxin [Methanomicrobiales archaeon]